MRMAERLFSSQRNCRDILVDRIATMRADAMKMPWGVERERLLKLARQLDVSAKLHAWAESPALQRPT
jgi:hypothetical protein